MPMTFDPNSKPDRIWATYCPTRSNGGKFKLHKTRANAINAFNNHGLAILFEWQGSQWVEIVRREHDTAPPFCDECGNPGKPQQWARSYVCDGRLVGKLLRDRGKLRNPLELGWLCKDCVRHYA